MAFDVELASNRMILKNGSAPISSITYVGIDSIKPLVERIMDYGDDVPSTLTSQWSVLITMRDGRQEKFRLGGITSQSGWTNNANGYANAEDDIYNAFP